MENSDKLTAIREVQRATEAAMQAVITYLQNTEGPVAEAAHDIIDQVLTAHDCESPEGHIVAGGILSAEPHEIGQGALPKQAPVVIDIYPRSKTTGYFADMTRTVCIGTPPPELQKMYDTVLAAQERAIALIQPGVTGSELHAVAEDIFREADYKTSGEGDTFNFAEGFVHSLGHGVGREIHERPYIGSDSTDVLKVGDIITIEPGLYYKHIGGVRLEDMLLVTESGAENLTHFPKQLEI